MTPLSRWIIRAAVTVYILAIGYWALNAGLRLREDSWVQTRSIHFEQDINNAFRWGTNVLAAGHELAGKSSDKRDLTLFEILRGEGSVYQDLALNNPPDSNYELDYPPLRLLTNALWVRHIQSIAPDLSKWPGRISPHYRATGNRTELATEDLVKPLLMMNTCAEAAAALFAFFLVALWVNRGGRPALSGNSNRLVPWKSIPLRKTYGLFIFPVCAAAFFYALFIIESPVQPSETRGIIADDIWYSLPQWFGVGLLFILMAASMQLMPPPHRAWAAGLVAALLVWFDPSFLVDGHVYPQWDVWLVPFFLLAALLASLDWWLLSGAVLGFAIMFKGQILVAGPILILWPIIAGRWGAAARLIIGFITMAGLIVSPWLVLNDQPPDWTVGPLRWISSVMAAAIISGALSLYRKPLIRRAREIWNELRGPSISAAAASRLSPSPGTPGEGRGEGLPLSPQSSVLAPNEFPPSPYPSAAAATEGTSAAPSSSPPLPLSPSPPHPYTPTPTPTTFLELIVFGATILAGTVLMTVLVLQRWPSDAGSPSKILGLFFLLAVMLLPWLLPRRAMLVWLIAILGSSLWLSSALFHGDWSWKTVGFDYGTRKHTQMALGANSIGNLPRILETRFGWDVHDPAMSLVPPDIAHGLGFVKPGAAVPDWLHTWGLDGTTLVLDIRQFLMGVFGIIMLLCAIGAAIQSRRNHPRVLAALAAIWMLMPQVLCQMTGRYMCWASAMSCLLVGLSPGLTLMHIVISAFAAGMIGAQLLASDQSRAQALYDLSIRFGPDDGLIMLNLGVVVLYLAVAPGRRPAKEELSLP